VRVLFCGVGEAFDEALPNTCLLVEAYAGGDRREVLLDCGFTAPYSYWRYGKSLDAAPDGPDAVWLSHFHGDHFLGFPALAARMAESGRTRELRVAGRQGVGMAVCRALDLAYPNLRANLGFALKFDECLPDEPLELLGLTFSGAFTTHPEPCLALRLEDDDASLYYSGDGAPSAECLALAWGAGLLVQEAYALAPGTPGHGSVEEAVQLARMASPGALALVHLERTLRADRLPEIMAALDGAGYLPEPGHIHRVGA
jgi:ribonuclease BN (tRNA processing enzyme)